MTFTINNIRWKLRIVNPGDTNLKRSDGSYTLGVTDRNKNTVYLAADLSDEMKEKVLCHELVHCACFTYGYTLDIKTEEIIADFMSLYGHDIIFIADDILYKIRRAIA